MKKTAALSLVFVLFITGCSTLQEFDVNKYTKKPRATIEKFTIEKASFKDITFLFVVGIQNYYPIGITLDDISFDVKIDGNQFLKTSTKKRMKIEARKKSTTPVNLTLKYNDIIKIVNNYANRDYLDCTIDTTISIPLPEFVQSLKKNVTFSYTLIKKIPAIKPTIRIANFKVQKPSLSSIMNSMKKEKISSVSPKKVSGMFDDLISGKKASQVIDPQSIDVPITVSFDIIFKNETRAKLYFKKLQYVFFINNNRLVDGTTFATRTVGSESIITVSNRFSSRALGSSILSAFKKRKGTFSLRGTSYVQLPASIKRTPLSLKFNEVGEFSF